ncbi:RNA polymerase factor sigma-54 [Ketobacter sp. MCCC 1A13808]|uniref:RNA polymerase factor sigma-54 n=1 Tax=Ketobacter sp. MCCC 1A13808 TaxID=2602738 RepID=UPI000F237B12|nr:RNA polymerase factor sigma-54 [Ketobacter sp. MCCC 1A13808]MVF11248.1 RNA polymerase factor sigma-54 [Ketobacter sp. MCCC 1A13808]RLP53621.1 MAG: RNA polymerase factor sigma-54 [Ketobacter sp.]
MKPTLQLKIGQHLTMTPQLQQAIRLLQLSTLDLQAEIQEALEANPLLDVEESGDDNSNTETDNKTEKTDNLAESDSVPDFTQASEVKSENSTQSAEDASVDLEGKQISDELPVDSDWDTMYDSSGSTLSGSSGSGGDDDDFDYESRNSAPESIYDSLMWQLNLTTMSDVDQMIAMAVIEAVDNKGYLTQSVEDIRESVLAQKDVISDLIRLQQEELDNLGIVLQPDEDDEGQPISLEEVVAVLHRIQQFDPPGVAARDLRECLLIQLKQMDKSEPSRDDAILVVDTYLETLGSRDFATIMRKGKLSEARLKSAISLIQSLNPYPGSSIETDDTQYVIPDVIVSKDKGRWRVELNPDATPRLRVNGNYASLIQRADNSSDNTFLKNNLQEARWFIKSLQSRNETLLKVSTKIVEHQIGFLEQGEEAMKPLVLHDIAEAVGMHESTISRVTTQKFMHTPRGIFELKYFFSSHLSTNSGGECSSTAIRAIIKKLIAAENPKKPLSDSKIANILEEQDIKVARRTIAKYREAMMIPPSNERKRLV